MTTDQIVAAVGAIIALIVLVFWYYVKTTEEQRDIMNACPHPLNLEVGDMFDLQGVVEAKLTCVDGFTEYAVVNHNDRGRKYYLTTSLDINRDAPVHFYGMVVESIELEDGITHVELVFSGGSVASV